MIMPDSFPSTSNHLTKEENNELIHNWPYFSEATNEKNEPIIGTSSPKNNGFVYKRRKFVKNGVSRLKELEESQDKSSRDLKELENSQIKHISKDSKELEKPQINQLSNDLKELEKPQINQSSKDSKEFEKPQINQLSNDSKEFEKKQINQLSKDLKEFEKSEINQSSKDSKELEKPQINQLSKDSKEFEKSQINQLSKDLKDKFCSSSNSENCDLNPNINAKRITRSNNKPIKIHKKQVLNDLPSRDLCISILKNQISSIKTLNRNPNKNKNNNKICIRCKVCNALEYSNKMLICDKCEEAYHLSCSNEKIKRIKMENWYCLSCSSGRTVLAQSKLLEERKRLNCRDGNPIRVILSDRWHHTIGVRVGKDFQADIPHYLGPIDHDLSPCFEPMKIDLLESSTSNLWCNRPKSKGVGHWVQCREIIHTNDNGHRTICGKWRRVPFSVEQTDDWECSYLLPFDPFHADCAVPQEVETNVVYEQLKYSRKFQKLLERKKK